MKLCEIKASIVFQVVYPVYLSTSKSNTCESKKGEGLNIQKKDQRPKDQRTFIQSYANPEASVP